MRPYDFEKADLVLSEAYDKENESGFLDRIKRGEIALWNESSNVTEKGQVRDVSLDATTTGGIADLGGKATTEFDLVKVIIETGGTFAFGSASAVTYSVYSGDSTGLKVSQVIDSEIIDGSYQSMAHGVTVRFKPGVYVANDEWEVLLNGQPIETGNAIKQFQAVR